MALTKFWFSTPTSADGNPSDRPNCLLTTSVPSWNTSTGDEQQATRTSATLSFRNASNVQQQLVTITTPTLATDTFGTITTPTLPNNTFRKIDTTFSLNAITFRKVVLTFGTFVATFTAASDITVNASSAHKFICGYENGEWDIGDETYLPYADFKWITQFQPNVATEGNLVLDLPSPSITVSYNGNGNTSGTAPTTQTGASSYTVSNQGTLLKDGYDFTGWNTAANGSGTAYAVGSTISVNATLYAQWTIATHDVTFIGNDGLWNPNGVTTNLWCQDGIATGDVAFVPVFANVYTDTTVPAISYKDGILLRATSSTSLNGLVLQTVTEPPKDYSMLDVDTTVDGFAGGKFNLIRIVAGGSSITVSGKTFATVSGAAYDILYFGNSDTHLVYLMKNDKLVDSEIITPTLGAQPPTITGTYMLVAKYMGGAKNRRIVNDTFTQDTDLSVNVTAMKISRDGTKWWRALTSHRLIKVYRGQLIRYPYQERLSLSTKRLLVL